MILVDHKPVDQDLWIIVRSYDMVTIHSDEDAARDDLRRKDSLFKCRLADVVEVKP